MTFKIHVTVPLLALHTYKWLVQISLFLSNYQIVCLLINLWWIRCHLECLITSLSQLFPLNLNTISHYKLIITKQTIIKSSITSLTLTLYTSIVRTEKHPCIIVFLSSIRFTVYDLYLYMYKNSNHKKPWSQKHQLYYQVTLALNRPILAETWIFHFCFHYLNLYIELLLN